MADFPIEMFLLNENSNYCNNKSTGKAAHHARIAFEDYISKVNDRNKIIKLYQTLIEVGLGRQIIGVYQKR